MREILFRGKRTDNGEWVTSGTIIHFCDNGVHEIYMPKLMDKCICGHDEVTDAILSMYNTEIYRIDPETVGQYTGLTDKNGKKIFEGDIVTASALDFRKVEFVDNPYWCAFCVVAANDDCEYINEYSDLEVIGNIHDNPELIGGVGDG